MVLQEQLGRQEHIGQQHYIPPVESFGDLRCFPPLLWAAEARIPLCDSGGKSNQSKAGEFGRIGQCRQPNGGRVVRSVLFCCDETTSPEG